MVHNINIRKGVLNHPDSFRDASLAEQLRWLVELRWLAIVGIVAAVTLGKYLFLALDHVLPLYVCAGFLLCCNTLYFILTSGTRFQSRRSYIVLGMIQVELDLFFLAVVLYLSGGLSNPFTLFFIFHVIIAAIILPRWHSLVVAVTAVALYGVLAVNEMEGGGWPGYHPLHLETVNTLWRDRLYVHGAYLAFTCTVFLARYLTRIVIVRMTKKELEAARNHDVLKAVIRAMNEGLVFLDQDRQVVFANPAAQDWLSEQTSDLLDIKTYPNDLQRYVHDLNGDPQTHAALNFQTDHAEPRTIEVKGSPVIDLDGQTLGHVVVGRDLTEHKRLEQELMEQAEQVTAINETLKMSRVKMAQREKMVAVGQMAAGIAHEIGNPLASLSSVVQYLQRKSTIPAANDQLGVMQTHIARISNILKRMLSFSRPATAEFRWADLNQIIESTLSLVKFDQRMRNVEIKHEINETIPTVWLNPQSFEQVLLNIFLNAMDAMQPKDDQQEKCLTVTCSCMREFVEVRIRDTGIGMEQEVADRAFESFFTTKEMGKGTGLGLFISHNLVTEIDGSIRIESEPQQGTTVIVQVPVRPKAALFSEASTSVESSSGDSV